MAAQHARACDNLTVTDDTSSLDGPTESSRSLRQRVLTIPSLVVLYAVVAGAWIIGSDILLGSLHGRSAQSVAADIGKGLAFVAVTAVLLAVLLHRRDVILDAERGRAARLESTLDDARRMDAVGRLARGTAHDVNNLLAVIRGHIDLARLDALPEQLDSLDAIDVALDRAVDLTHELQTVAGRQNLDLEPVDLTAYLATQRATLRAILPDSVELDLDAPDTPITVMLDPVRFEQVLLNLATNAGDAMPDGGRLHIAMRAEGDDAIVEVTDTGHGMTAEVARLCVEPFFTTKTGRGRSGMGLSIAYGVVRQSGGRIGIDSTPGAGTTFTISLPLVADGASAPCPPA